MKITINQYGNNELMFFIKKCKKNFVVPKLYLYLYQ